MKRSTFSRSAWAGLAGGLGLLVLGLAAARRWVHLRVLAGLLGAALIVLLPFLLSSAPLLGTRLNLDGSFAAASSPTMPR